MTVRQVLVHKGGGVHAIHPEATVLDALRKLAEHDIGALLVMEGERLLGIFTERDYARKLAAERDLSTSSVSGHKVETFWILQKP